MMSIRLVSIGEKVPSGLNYEIHCSEAIVVHRYFPNIVDAEVGRLSIKDKGREGGWAGIC